MTTDLYALLEVDRAASHRQIRSAYRRLARAYHPDHNSDPNAAERFKSIAEAYAVLSDNGRRSTYDHTGQTRSDATVRAEVEDSAFE